MPEHKSDSDRWRELAEILGVPAEESAQQPAAVNEPSPASERRPEHHVRDVSDDAPERHSEPSSFDTQVEAPQDRSRLQSSEEPLPPQPREWVGAVEIVEASVELSRPEETGPAEADDEDRPRRGRRRGRRGRKGRGDEGGAAEESGPRERVPVEASDDEELMARSGQDNEILEDEPSETECDEELEEVAENSPAMAEEEEDDAEIDKLKDWNVPSWNELIASLYRPDR